MGMSATRRLAAMLENVRSVLATELCLAIIGREE
jgi:histidine ammonia-lyase